MHRLRAAPEAGIESGAAIPIPISIPIPILITTKRRPGSPCAGWRAAPLAVAAFGFFVSAAGCSDEPARSACTVGARELRAPGQPNALATPLMLLPDARLDARTDGGFVLLGTDGDNVRWALLGADGVVEGDEQAIPVPAHDAGPWFALAGVNAPNDHLVIAYLPAAATPPTPVGSVVELMTFSVRIDNTAPTAPVSSGQISASAKVVMMSGRAGMHAGVAWSNLGRSPVSARILGGGGLPLGPDLDLGIVEDLGVDGSPCLRFSPGRGDLTLGFLDVGLPADPVFVATEIDELGAALTPFRLRLGKQKPSCVKLVHGTDGYGLAWYSTGLGTYFSLYDPVVGGLPSFRVASDVRVRVPLDLGGLGWLGKQFAVLFGPTRGGAEVWPINARAERQGALPVLPSRAGFSGPLSTQQVGPALFATYVDYADALRVSGSRIFVKVSCPEMLSAQE